MQKNSLFYFKALRETWIGLALAVLWAVLTGFLNNFGLLTIIVYENVGLTVSHSTSGHL